MESWGSASCPVVQKRAVWGAQRVFLLSPQEAFSDEGQADLPLESPAAVGHFPPGSDECAGLEEGTRAGYWREFSFISREMRLRWWSRKSSGRGDLKLSPAFGTK